MNAAALFLATTLALPPDVGAAVDSVFESLRPDQPGCAVGVVAGGELVFARGYGLASVEHDAPITPDTPFQIASLSKSFMASIIALLAEEGKLSLDDDVRRWVPELHPREPVVRIRHLVGHTSGIRDYLGLLAFAGIDPQGPVAPEDVLSVLSHQKTGNFPAGSDFAYSNSGYFLLGVIAERATGQPLREVARTRIFDPLGMKRTAFPPGPRVIPGRATSYRLGADDQLEPRHVMNPLGGEGAMWSTVRDLARYEANFLDNRLGKGDPKLTEMLTTGDDGSYVFGWRVLRQRGRRALAHGGTWAGYRVFYRRLPDEQLAAIVLCNQDELSPNALSERVIDVLLGEAVAPEPPHAPEPAPATSQVTDADRSAIPGRFYNEELDTIWTLAFDGDTLLVRVWLWPPKEFSKIEADTFQARDRVKIVVRRDENGRVRSFTTGYGRARDVLFTRR